MGAGGVSGEDREEFRKAQSEYFNSENSTDSTNEAANMQARQFNDLDEEADSDLGEASQPKK